MLKSSLPSSPKEPQAGAECLEGGQYWQRRGPSAPRPGLTVVFPGWAPQGQAFSPSPSPHCQRLINLKGRHKCRMHVSVGWVLSMSHVPRDCWVNWGLFSWPFDVAPSLAGFIHQEEEEVTPQLPPKPPAHGSC